jgi:hypothetical protein
MAGAGGWCWFVLREKYCWLVVGGWFVLREKYCWPVADKPPANRAHVPGQPWRISTPPELVDDCGAVCRPSMGQWDCGMITENCQFYFLKKS